MPVDLRPAVGLIVGLEKRMWMLAAQLEVM